MDIDKIILSEENIIYHLNMEYKNNTNEYIYETEMDSQTQKTNLWLSKRKGKRRTINQVYGINRHKLHITDKQQGFATAHRD